MRRHLPAAKTPNDVSKLSVAGPVKVTESLPTTALPVVRAYNSGSGVVGVGSVRRCSSCSTTERVREKCGQRARFVE